MCEKIQKSGIVLKKLRKHEKNRRFVLSSTLQARVKTFLKMFHSAEKTLKPNLLNYLVMTKALQTMAAKDGTLW